MIISRTDQRYTEEVPSTAATKCNNEQSESLYIPSGVSC